MRAHPSSADPNVSERRVLGGRAPCRTELHNVIKTQITTLWQKTCKNVYFCSFFRLLFVTNRINFVFLSMDYCILLKDMVYF